MFVVEPVRCVSGELGAWKRKCLLPGLVNIQKDGKSPFSMGKSTINGPFSIAMLAARLTAHGSL